MLLEMRGNPESAVVDPQIADITDVDKMDRLFEQIKPEIVFHAAAYKQVPLMELFPDSDLTFFTALVMRWVADSVIWLEFLVQGLVVLIFL